MSAVKFIQALRESGHTTRAHVIPHISHYAVDGHTWQAMTLLFALHPNPSVNLIKTLHFHDTPERWTGDWPSPIKNVLYNGERVSVISTKLEADVARKMGMEAVLGRGLKDDEKQWLTAVDVLELWLWCEDEMAMGNKHVQRCHTNCSEWFTLNMEKLPPAVKNFVINYKWTRTSEKGFWNDV